MGYNLPSTHIAPSAPPTAVTVSKVTSSSITVQWGMVPCIHRNGEITGYSVRYGEMGSENTQTMNVSENSATIQDLMSSTTYSIHVAAVNSAGVGEPSRSVVAKPQGKLCIH